MPNPVAAVKHGDLGRRIHGWARIWGLPGLESRVSVELSTRLRRSLGRCLPAKGMVRLNARLLEAPTELFIEVLCHEVAHVAAYELVGKKRYRPHGPEWKELMRKAGFQPRVRMDLGSGPLARLLRATDTRHPAPDTQRGRSPRYEHRCPVCQAVRFARRRVPQWRCARCLSAGLDGKLVIAKRK